MLRFHAPAFVAGVAALNRAVTALTLGYENGHAELEQAISELRTVLGELPLTTVVTQQFERLERRVTASDATEWNTMLTLVTEFHNNLLTDIAAHYYLLVPSDRRPLYEQRQPVFGEAVARAFPDASYDIAAAGRCFSLDEWTACIFHLMRVLEHGLHTMAGRLQVVMATPIELENWKNVIDLIETAIRQQEQAPKSQAKSIALQFYSEAASNLRYFKDAWRNHVSHSRATYDEREATLIWNHVRAFMERLATPPSGLSP